MSLFNKILIPVDGSKRAEAASAKGLELAKLMMAEVTVISVADVGQLAHSAAGPNLGDLERYIEQEAVAAVERICEQGKKMGVLVKTVVKKGSAAKEIIEASKDFDLIVMNHLGHTGLAEHLLGGVAEKVVRFASCPVLVMRVQ